MKEPGEDLSAGLEAAADDAEQRLEHHGQPAGSGNKLWSRLQET